MKELERIRSYFESGATRSLSFRLEMLDRLERLVFENERAITQALQSDFHRSAHESFLGEVAVTIEEIRYLKRHLAKWMKPKRVAPPLALWPSKARVYYEPKGIALVIAPWNYPFHLAVAPLAGAIAAGNCAVLKPSEITAHTSKLLRELFARYFPPEYIQVVEGGVPETTALLAEKFDHIFFTGSGNVGRIVMEAAAKQLTPVTLELGGKSPVIVCGDADLELAARRITWGKFFNAGQTCVAPDYLYVDRAVASSFLEKLRKNIIAQFGENQRTSKDYARIVNRIHFDRICRLIDPGKVFFGGESDAAELFIQPTILCDVDWKDAVMQEEIFGPVLPVLTFGSLDDVILDLRQRPKPLAAYLFTRTGDIKERFVRQISFGGGCVNDVLAHLGCTALPFGGVGASGIGNYHGEYSFRTFSHEKGVAFRSGFLDVSARYAPYDDKKTKFLRKIFGV